MDDKILYIYMLVDPRNDLPFYVGRPVDPKRRRKEHIQDGKQKNTTHRKLEQGSKCCFISSILSDGLQPEIVILDSCQINDSMRSNFKAMNFWEHLWASLVLSPRTDVFSIYSIPIIPEKTIKSYIANVKHALEIGGYARYISLAPRKKGRMCSRDITKAERKRLDKQMKEFAELIGIGWLINDL